MSDIFLCCIVKMTFHSQLKYKRHILLSIQGEVRECSDQYSEKHLSHCFKHLPEAVLSLPVAFIYQLKLKKGLDVLRSSASGGYDGEIAVSSPSSIQSL